MNLVLCLCPVVMVTDFRTELGGHADQVLLPIILTKVFENYPQFDQMIESLDFTSPIRAPLPPISSRDVVPETCGGLRLQLPVQMS